MIFNFYNWPVTKPLTSSKYIYIYSSLIFPQNKKE